MAKNVMKMLKPSPTLGRNAFDMSCRDVNTINFGELLPIYSLETVPGDKIKIRVSDLLRAAPMVTSPFMRAKQHVDFWFVPYSMLWSRFNDFISDKSEPNSAALKNFLFCPTADLGELINGIASSSQTTVLGTSFKDPAYRLLDALGYPCEFGYYNGAAPESGVKVNLFRLAAYQKIWYSEYRNQYYDTGLLGMEGATDGLTAARLFNFDDLDCATVSTSDILSRDEDNTIKVVNYMCQMRYRQWKKDLFTGMLPSTQFGAVSAVDITGTSLESSFGALIKSRVLPSGNALGVKSAFVGDANVSSTYQKRLYAVTSSNDGPNATNSHWDITPDHGLALEGSFDILSLRRAEAVQKWRENALRAGNQVEDNFEAHFGVKPNSHLKTHPTFIGSYDAPLNIGDVNATAATENPVNGSVGDVAGKGLTSLDGREIHFQTTDFGVVMGILSVLPESEYMSYGIDRGNQLSERFDFFTPEMENLGLEAIDKKTFRAQVQAYEWSEGILGYAPRYWGYKTKVDKCHLDFYHTNGAYRQWTSPRYINVAGGSAIPLSWFYVNPAVFANNFVDTQGMQFIADVFVDCEAIRPMSVLGLPTF